MWWNIFKIEPGRSVNRFQKINYRAFSLCGETFLRLSLADRLVVFKESIPKRERQALRSGLASIPTKKSIASKNVISYECGICGNLCTTDYDTLMTSQGSDKLTAMF